MKMLLELLPLRISIVLLFVMDLVVMIVAMLHGGAYVGLDFFRRELFSLFVEFGVDYGVLGVYTPFKIGFRL